MGKHLTGVALVLTSMFVLAGCAGTPVPVSTVPAETAAAAPAETETAAPAPKAEPGTRSNPLAIGETRKLSEASMWTLGASAATEVHDGYAVLPLYVGFDWEAGRAQGLDIDNDGADPSFSVMISFVTADGRSFTTMDDYNVDNEWYSVGTVYPPTEGVYTRVPISVPADQVPGGLWRLENSVGDAVFIATQ